MILNGVCDPVSPGKQSFFKELRVENVPLGGPRLDLYFKINYKCKCACNFWRFVRNQF